MYHLGEIQTPKGALKAPADVLVLIGGFRGDWFECEAALSRWCEVCRHGVWVWGLKTKITGQRSLNVNWRSVKTCCIGLHCNTQMHDAWTISFKAQTLYVLLMCLCFLGVRRGSVQTEMLWLHFVLSDPGSEVQTSMSPPPVWDRCMMSQLQVWPTGSLHQPWEHEENITNFSLSIFSFCTKSSVLLQWQSFSAWSVNLVKLQETSLWGCPETSGN